MAQQKHVQRRLKQALIELEEITEKRVKEYQQEQEIHMIQDKRMAMYDGTVLWQTMKEVAKTVHEEEERIKRLSHQDDHNNRNSADQNFVKRIFSEEEQNPNTHGTREVAIGPTKKPGSHVHFSSYGSDTILGNEERRRRSSVFKREFFGGFAPSSYSSDRRRSSYELDESSISHSLKRQHGKNGQHHELPTLYRRPSHAPPNQYLHPLASRDNEKEDDNTPDPNLATAATINTSNNSSSLEDENEKENNQVEDDLGDKRSGRDSDDMFALDEDIDYDADASEQRRASNRRVSSKYNDAAFDEELDEDDDSAVDVSLRSKHQQQRNGKLHLCMKNNKSY